ncbi:MAG: tetratricopeptide repeat protein [Planctomycetes bacterium]|nr:tetratricopeptide repeat protein [Planctomycetota bacterium]
MSSESHRIPLLASLYQQYLDRHDSADFANRVSGVYAQGTLQRLSEHDSPLVRRAAVLALGFIGDYEVNHVMGRALHDEDRTVRTLAENGIQNVWRRAGDDDQRQTLSALVDLNSAKRFDEASRRATELTRKAPWLAEAWSQRATANLALGRYNEAIRDCHQTLEINPYHFAAASGMGRAYLQLNNHLSALESFRRALRLNPSLESVRAQITRLTRLIEGK